MKHQTPPPCLAEIVAAVSARYRVTLAPKVAK
jgi:hypothetical protein